jgi:hypothetical protein
MKECVLAACIRGSDGTTWGAPWRDAKWGVVDERIVSTVRGPEHCGWESAVLLYLSWPLGTPAKSADDARQYVRDPEGILAVDTVMPVDPDARRPAEARDTGYRLGEFALWVGDDARTAVYVVRGSEVERWPRAKHAIACA